MLLSIIIPTKNEEENIARVLNSILKQPSFDPKEIEIIVIDNPNTTDATREITRQFPVRLDIIGPERSSQRNQGAKLASGKYICFIDADMEFSDHLLGEIVANLIPNTAMVLPERIPGNTLFCRALNLEKHYYDGNDLISAARVFPKTQFMDLGGFNSEMSSGEDWDLDRRFKANDGVIIHLHQPLYHHEENIGFFKSIHKKIYYAQQLKNYSIGVQNEISPIYRYGLFFSKPLLALTHPIAFTYLIFLKSFQFGIGAIIFTYHKYVSKI